MNSFISGASSGWFSRCIPGCALIALIAGMANIALADSHLVSDTITLQSGPVCRGSQAIYSLQLARVESGKMMINLTAAGLPAGVTASFSPAVVELGGNDLTAHATMTLFIGQSIAPGNYSFSVIASAGGSNNTITNTVPLEIGMCSAGIALMNSGCICLAFDTVPGQRYVVQATPDLTNPVWTDICTTNMAANLLVMADMDSTNYPMRFYRSALVQ